MGKRKSRQVQSKGPPPKVDTVFDCPFCSHRHTIEVKMQRKAGNAKLFCRVCNLVFHKKLSPLDKEVDVYCAWIDSANAVNKKGQGQIGLVGGKDSDSEDDDGPIHEKVTTKKKVRVVANSDSDEEYKELPNPENMPNSAAAISKPNNLYSASDKIAELGLG